ncbi:hypothetical protein BBK36DRAFT_1131374 [Trichoderma citrinoviride]|uniref:2EXR domain-containing protein n=1 Tax=Trichoderma citrinoviride TaxID=58853 RepID=A0A2T4AWY7_9HYPO|nr:hypothetical protein BBK36DRAFT_1131374 [Trichoderma citrinoviride]PTB61587.1 hypothetical protein BBK36DRAFT_1131374 [Trichoderma citrinoviride]
MAPYRTKHSKDGNALFAKLPPEIRCKIWSLLVVKPNGSVFPVHIPTYSATETFVCMDWTHKATNVTLQLEAIMQTCKLFYKDQETHMLFYKLNRFQFRGSRDCLTYVASITPSRRQAIRSITISMHPMPYKLDGAKGKKPSERLLAIASLCPGLQVFKNHNLFFQADSLTDWASVLSRFLEAFVSQLPLLKEISFRGGKGGRAVVSGSLAESPEFYWETLDQFAHSWRRESVSFSIRGEEALTAVWNLLRDRKRAVSLPLHKSHLRAAIGSTPILTLGENRGMPCESNRGIKHKDDGISRVPVNIFGRGISIRGFRIPCDTRSPRLYIGKTWYDWDSIFHSKRISEAESKRFLDEVLIMFAKRYRPWACGKRASKGRRHGNRRAQQMINAIWELNWQDREAKLKVLKRLYKASRTGWRGRGYYI